MATELEKKGNLAMAYLGPFNFFDLLDTGGMNLKSISFNWDELAIHSRGG